jgi:hypothetical protein
MVLPEYVTPVLTVVGVPALVFVILRSFPPAARAAMVLVAGIVAIVTRDKDRRESCHEVLDKVTRNDAAPSSRPRALGLPPRKAPGREGEAPDP